MADETLAIVRSQIECLREQNESARIEREDALQAVSEYEQAITQNEATINVLEAIVAAASHITHVDRASEDDGDLADSNGEKLSATNAIFSLIKQHGPSSRERVLALEDRISSDAKNKRHILQTTLYQLRKRGRLVETEEGLFDLPGRLAR